MIGESKHMWTLTLNMGLGCLGCDGAAAAVVAAGAGVGAVTWSAGNDSGTVWRVGLIVVDIFTITLVQSLYTSLAHPRLSHPLRRPRLARPTDPGLHQDADTAPDLAPPIADQQRPSNRIFDQKKTSRSPITKTM